MRYVILRKAGTRSQAGSAAPLSAAPGILLHESAELQPDAAAVCIRFPDGVPQRGRPASTGTAPVLTSLSIVEADSREAAIDWLRNAPAAVADTEFELRETGCAGGLPGVDPSIVASRPRFLVLVKADADTEAEAPSDPARLAAMARCNDEAVRSGLLLAADGLRATASGTRVKFDGRRSKVMDGPFAEAKELIAGFWLIQADSIDDAIAWVERYPYAQAAPEVEIHPVTAR